MAETIQYVTNTITLNQALGFTQDTDPETDLTDNDTFRAYLENPNGVGQYITTVTRVGSTNVLQVNIAENILNVAGYWTERVHVTRSGESVGKGGVKTQFLVSEL